MLKGALSRLIKMGGKELALELLDRFLVEGPKRLEMAREALQEGDLHALQHHFHRLTSDAGWLGASDVQQLASSAEVQASQGRLEGLPQILDSLSELCFQVCMSLEQEKARLLDPHYTSAEGMRANS